MTQQDGESYATGLRIGYQHCAGCGAPTNIVQPMSHDRIEMSITTDCCGFLPCYGYVVDRAWQAQSDPTRTVWACCSSVGDQYLGEPVWLPPLAD